MFTNIIEFSFKVLTEDELKKEKANIEDFCLSRNLSVFFYDDRHYAYDDNGKFVKYYFCYVTIK